MKDGRADKHYVYLYRDGGRRPRYVGLGGAITRPEEHVRGSHNEGLRRLIASGDYSIEVTGPYRDEEESEAVESALISALRMPARPALTNISDGNGSKFRPFGVPHEAADRLGKGAVTLRWIGKETGGALLVCLSSGGTFAGDPERAKFDPSRPLDSVVSENTRRWWQIGRLVELWTARPADAPRVLIGVAGPPRRRYLVGALRIDNSRWRDAEKDGARWSVPLKAEMELDACRLRGRIVEGARFGRGRQDHFIWVDGRGVVRYEPRRR